jgi:CBS domain-containing protein
VRDIMQPDPLVLSADETIRSAVDRTFPPRRYVAYPVVDGASLPVGLLPFHRVARVPEARWDETRVRDVMVPSEQAVVLSGEDDLADAVTKLLQTHPGRGLVVRNNGLEGLLSITDAEHLVEGRPQRRARGPASPLAGGPSRPGPDPR